MAAKKKTKKWIKTAIKRPGALRKKLGAKKGKPIPKGKLKVAAKKKGRTGKQARMAMTMMKMKPKKKMKKKMGY